jgi:hypothetical protein
MIDWAVQHRIFADQLSPAVQAAIEGGARAETHLRSLSRVKVRAKVRTMAKNNKQVGLPGVTEFTKARGRKRVSRPRVRYAAASGQDLKFLDFKRKFAHLGKSAMLERWQAYPRRMLAPRARLHDNEAISWQKCCRWWSWCHEIDDLHDWPSTLPRAP